MQRRIWAQRGFQLVLCGILAFSVSSVLLHAADIGSATRPVSPEVEAKIEAVKDSWKEVSLDPTSPAMEWWRQSVKTRDQRLGWWRQARFGMFIHWGVYSHLGGTWQGKPKKGYAEHIQRAFRIPIPIYRDEVAGAFNPTEFNADQWVRTAKQAGMGYIVITAKHHDGFAMYDSKVSDYNIVKATPFKRDPMKELKAACDKYGIKLGFYYSHAFDWGEQNGAGNDWDYQNPGGDLYLHTTRGNDNWWTTYPQFLPNVHQYVDEKAIPQIQELIRQYDPGLLWFDTPHKLPPQEDMRILKAARLAGPNIVINGRIIKGNFGDYSSTSDMPAEFPPRAGDWEGVPTTNDSYGYNQNDHSQKPASYFIRLLAKAVARGGNTLMNIGPMGTGQFDPVDQAILEGIGKWNAINGDSIHGCDRTPLTVQAWGESTRNGNTLYLHVFDWPDDGQLVVGVLSGRVKSATLLSDTTHAPLKFRQLNDRDLAIDVPSQAPDAVDSVIELQTDGNFQTDTDRLLSSNQTNLLRVFDGLCQGPGLKFGTGKRQTAHVEGWSSPDAYVSWNTRLNEPTVFKVSVAYDAIASSSDGKYIVAIGAQTLEGTVRANIGDPVELGTIKVPTGTLNITVKAVAIKGPELMWYYRYIVKSGQN